jgi:hypothetical protein
MSGNKVFFAKVKVLCFVKRGSKTYAVVDVNSVLQTNLKNNAYIDIDEFAGNLPQQGQEIEVAVRITKEKVYVSYAEVKIHKKIQKLTEMKNQDEELSLNVDENGKLSHEEIDCVFRVKSVEKFKPNSVIKAKIRRISQGKNNAITLFCEHTNPQLSFAIHDKIRVRIEKTDKFFAYCKPILENAEINNSVSCLVNIGNGFSLSVGSEIDVVVVYINQNILIVNYLPFQVEKFTNVFFPNQQVNNEKIFKAEITAKYDRYLSLLIKDEAVDEEFSGVLLAQEIAWDSSKIRGKMKAFQVGEQIEVVYYGANNSKNNQLNFSIKRKEANPVISLMDSCGIGTILQASALQNGQNKNFIFVKLTHGDSVVEAVLHRNEFYDLERESIEGFSKIKAGDNFSVVVTGANRDKQSISISKRAFDYSYIADRRMNQRAKIVSVSADKTLISIRGILGVLHEPLIGAKIGISVFVNYLEHKPGELAVFRAKNAANHNQARKSKSLSSSLGALLDTSA